MKEEVEERYLLHYGTKYHSGRYPYGSGEVPYQHEPWFKFINEMNKVKADNPDMSAVDLAKALGLKNTTELRARISYANSEKRSWDASGVRQLWNDGLHNKSEIARRLGISEGQVRKIISSEDAIKKNNVSTVMESLADNVDRKGMIDVGVGIECQLGVSQTRLKNAVTNLTMDDKYATKEIFVEQLGTGKNTTMKILYKNEPPYNEKGYLQNHKDEIGMIDDCEISIDGKHLQKVPPIPQVSKDRIQIVYKEEGGANKDGVIELRRGVEDLNLGSARYAQVRIATEGGRYLKGMAMYADDLPDGVDIRFNSNKSKTKGFDGSTKEQGANPENPFGAAIRPKLIVDANGNVKGRSALNIVNEEGGWQKWSSTIASQFLSKQDATLVKKQLNLTYLGKKDLFEDYKALTNPEIKRRMLEEFADKCDSDAVRLKAEGLPRQAWNVILPFPNMPKDQIYAPHYENGTKLALVRYPHSGTFEIPVVTVNNKFQEAKDKIFNAKDAVGIHPSTAEQLSGADFDGDTVLCIPITKQTPIKASSPLKELKNFDTKEAYPYYEGMTVITERKKQFEMGKVSNLISDMTMIGGYTENEIARAVKHSMVIIDSKKHKLDWERSYRENNIEQLYLKYQGKPKGGASTLISRAKGTKYVNERSTNNPYSVDPKTGEKIFNYTGRTIKKFDKENKVYYDTGKLATQESTKMYEAKDAYELLSDRKHPYEKELLYADYANAMKKMGNEARLEASKITATSYSASAAKIYKNEVASLDKKLEIARSNSPYERMAQRIGNAEFAQIKKDNPDMGKDDLKKNKGRCLVIARERVGAKKQYIDITDKEWEAIQAGAITKSKLNDILDNADSDQVKKLATPRTENVIPAAKQARIKALSNSGLSIAEIAERVGVSTSTVDKYL